ncbi:DUF1161 domain-containing protein [Methylibium sp.]|uniref:DUF1161 domain-containing protein n=1 Tax=Methylibium sp. TaxID=2067992 RepID=UPI003D0D057D
MLKTSFCALATVAALAFTGAAGGAESCAALRERIAAKVRAAGATHYTLTTVDADAAASGKVVGRCELGTKKIVYARGEAGPGAAAVAAVAPATPAPARPRTEPLLTECKDGSVSLGGDCGK